jgi:hypothetical protein
VGVIPSSRLCLSLRHRSTADTGGTNSTHYDHFIFHFGEVGGLWKSMMWADQVTHKVHSFPFLPSTLTAYCSIDDYVTLASPKLVISFMPKMTIIS